MSTSSSAGVVAFSILYTAVLVKFFASGAALLLPRYCLLPRQPQWFCASGPSFQKLYEYPQWSSPPTHARSWLSRRPFTIPSNDSTKSTLPRFVSHLRTETSTPCIVFLYKRFYQTPSPKTTERLHICSARRLLVESTKGHLNQEQQLVSPQVETPVSTRSLQRRRWENIDYFCRD